MITVRTLADAAGTCPGASCSLRTAIAQANADPDCTRIEFDFTPVVGGYIALVSPLPTITSPVEIDGWSHPNTTRFPANGYSPGPGLRVGIRGDTNNIAGSGLRFLDAGYGLVQGLAAERLQHRRRHRSRGLDQRRPERDDPREHPRALVADRPLPDQPRRRLGPGARRAHRRRTHDRPERPAGARLFPRQLTRQLLPRHHGTRHPRDDEPVRHPGPGADHRQPLR